MQPEHFLNQAHALFLAGGHHGRFIQPQELFHFRRWLDATRSARLIPHTPLRCPIGVHGNRVIPQGRKQRIVTATAHVEGDLMLSRTGAGEPVVGLQRAHGQLDAELSPVLLQELRNFSCPRPIVHIQDDLQGLAVRQTAITCAIALGKAEAV